MTVQLRRIHHAAIICSNYEQSKHFYTTILGLQIIDEHYRAERASYKLEQDIDLEELSKYFVLSPSDLAEIKDCRGAVNKVGFAIQLCCLRWFGYLLPDLRNAPSTIVERLMQQLGITDLVDLSPYPQSENTRTSHPERIREYLGFQRCDELPRLRLLNYLTDQVINLPRTADLIDVSCEWLYDQKIVRPATRTLQEIITEAKTLGMERVYRLTGDKLTGEQKTMIDQLVEANPEREGHHCFERAPTYRHLDPIITGTIRTNLIHATWDDIVRAMASMQTRRVSASLILSKFSSYARQNSVYQGMREIGRVGKTKLILRCLHDEDFRRLQTKEINKGERSHDLDRFLFFRKQGALRSKDFLDQSHSFSCLAILHNAILVWNLEQLPTALDRLKARGHIITGEDLALVNPLLWKHANPFGRYHINVDRLKRDHEQ